MALDPHADREPGMDARVVTPSGLEYARSVRGTWECLGAHGHNGADWLGLASTFPDSTVVLP